jgi:preprotein translocase subunit YajC
VIVVLPQQRRQRKLQDMIDALKPGDKIVTTGGIYGTVVGVREDRIQVRVAENVKVEMSRNAVTALQNPEENKE